MQHAYSSSVAKLRNIARNTHGDVKELRSGDIYRYIIAYEIVQTWRLQWSGLRTVHQTFKSSNGN
jgi:hypothetical protein